MKATVSAKGQIVLPAEFRRMDRIEPGQEFDVERGDYRVVRRAGPKNEGAIDWLLACPRKDFFVPIDSESTADLTAAIAPDTAGSNGALGSRKAQLKASKFRPRDVKKYNDFRRLIGLPVPFANAGCEAGGCLQQHAPR